jgi:spermidine/putrescine transport system ATP-binding protein
MGKVLRLENIYKAFEQTPVLKGINLDVEEGEFITLLGSSGCGKTTTLRIIAGLEQAEKGKVWLNGEDITDLAPNKRNVNTVFQNYALFPHMTVAENIGYGLKIRKAPKEEIAQKVERMLRLVQLEGFGERRPDQLSGGQRQRVAIARAVINEPGVLLLDEPLGALDLKLRRQMQQELKRIQKQLGITFIYITHDQEEAINMSDRIAVMREGRFEQIGTPNEIYYKPRTSYVASFVGDANIYKEAGKTYAVRAENVLMDGEEACVMEAVIREKSFAGGQLRIVFELKDGQQITANRYGIDVDRRVGETIKIGWNKEQAVLVQDIEETEHGERKEA